MIGVPMGIPELETLERVISEVAEGAAFVFTDKLAQEPAPGSWSPVGVQLSFHGDPGGRIRLWADPGFARLAAANMLGVDEESDEAGERGIEALKELLNIIVGRFITSAYGDDRVFELGLPASVPPALISSDHTAENQCWIDADSHPLLFVLERE